MGSTTPVSSSFALSSGTTNNVISAASRDLFGRQFVTGSTTSGSPTVTMTAGSLLGVSVGDAMSGTGTATGATVSAVSSPTITMSLNGVSTGTGRNIRFHNGTIRYETIGTAPNRKLVVQWSKFSRYATSGPSDYMNFQIVLNETSNNVDIIYDFPYVNATGTHEVGLRGSSSADFNNRTTSSNWNSTTAGGSNSASCSVSNTIFPASGLTFRWAPPSCIAPAGLSNTSVTSTTASHSWTAPNPAPAVGYEWAVTTSATPPASGTATTNTTASSTSLTANTTYYLHVRSECTAGVDFSAWTSASFFTGYCLFSGTVATSYFNAFSTTGGTSNITNTSSGYSATGYGNFTAQTVTQQQGDNVNFTTTLVGTTVGVAIWVDWNDNLQFETSERMYNSAGYVSSAAGTFTVP
ncbi:MAG: hypothetical protein IPN86_05080 [Saprospiraceae bacterium]|nr:hypothetical protein [Saprospiraceae bacterium]